MTSAAHGGSAWPRLIATDLDGTLLRSDGTVSTRTREALAAVQARGIPLVFVTARPPRWLDELAELVGSHGTVLCGNGAFVYDVHARAVVSVHPLSFKDVGSIAADLRRSLPGTGFAAERAAGFAYEAQFASGHPVPAAAACGPIESHTDSPIGKLLARNPALPDEEFLARVVEIVGERAIVAYSGAGGLAEMSAPGVTKAVALQRWTRLLGIDATGVWAFGDMPNDLPMLRWAGRSIAVANAHPDVLAVASHTCAGNDEDGVAEVLERLVRDLDRTSSPGDGRTRKGSWTDH